MRTDVATRPGGRTSEASHNGLREHRSMPSRRRSMAMASASRPGPRASSVRRCDAAARLHDRHALDRLERAQEHAGADAGALARHVDAKMHAVYQVDVSMAAAQKQRAVAMRYTDVGVTAGVAGHVGLGFDDASPRAAVGSVAHERLADQKARERGGIDRKVGALQSSHGGRLDSRSAAVPGCSTVIDAAERRLTLSRWRCAGALRRRSAGRPR